MLMISPSLTWISVAHPTEQYGQMLGTVAASLMRSSCARATAGARLTPSALSPPSAVPAPAPAVSLRKSRRDSAMARTLHRRLPSNQIEDPAADQAPEDREHATEEGLPHSGILRPPGPHRDREGHGEARQGVHGGRPAPQPEPEP